MLHILRVIYEILMHGKGLWCIGGVVKYFTHHFHFVVSYWRFHLLLWFEEDVRGLIKRYRNLPSPINLDMRKDSTPVRMK